MNGSQTRTRWLLRRQQQRRPHDLRVLPVRAPVDNSVLIMVLYIFFRSSNFECTDDNWDRCFLVLVKCPW